MANKHCAYMKKDTQNSYIDLIPFISENHNQCIKRGEFQDFLAKGVEKSIDYINSFSSDK